MSSQLIPVNSSSIDSIGYGNKKSALIVKFKNGGLYVYTGVAKSVFDEFKNAGSLGKYHADNIKSNYVFQNIVESDISDWLDAPRSPRKTPYLVPQIFNGFQGAAAFF